MGRQFKRRPMSVEEYESALEEKSVGGVLGKLWPDVDQAKFETGMYNLYGSYGEQTPSHVKDLFYEITKTVGTMTYAAGRTCSAMGFYSNTKKELHVIMYAGSNGGENSIKRPLRHAAELLEELDKWHYEYAMTDVDIDVADDIYSFYIVIHTEIVTPTEN